jgi:hypothetical protein
VFLYAAYVAVHKRYTVAACYAWYLLVARGRNFRMVARSVGGLSVTRQNVATVRCLPVQGRSRAHQFFNETTLALGALPRLTPSLPVPMPVTVTYQARICRSKVPKLDQAPRQLQCATVSLPHQVTPLIQRSQTGPSPAATAMRHSEPPPPGDTIDKALRPAPGCVTAGAADPRAPTPGPC